MARSMACLSCLFPTAPASNSSASLSAPSLVNIAIVILRFPGMAQFGGIERDVSIGYTLS